MSQHNQVGSQVFKHDWSHLECAGSTITAVSNVSDEDNWYFTYENYTLTCHPCQTSTCIHCLAVYSSGIDAELFDHYNEISVPVCLVPLRGVNVIFEDIQVRDRHIRKGIIKLAVEVDNSITFLSLGFVPRGYGHKELVPLILTALAQAMIEGESVASKCGSPNHSEYASQGYAMPEAVKMLDIATTGVCSLCTSKMRARSSARNNFDPSMFGM